MLIDIAQGASVVKMVTFGVKRVSDESFYSSIVVDTIVDHEHNLDPLEL